MAHARAIFFAYPIEALGVIPAFGYERVSSSPFEIYRNAAGNILAISGIGQLNAANCFWHVKKNFGFAEALNVGAAGALKGGMKLGEIFQIEKNFSTDKYFGDSFALETPFAFKKAVLATSYVPVTTQAARDELAKKADLVDMEACGLCAAAKLHGVNMRAVKFVSDFSPGCSIPENIVKLRGVLEAHPELF